jgi:hypothetical protein
MVQEMRRTYTLVLFLSPAFIKINALNLSKRDKNNITSFRDWQQVIC